MHKFSYSRFLYIYSVSGHSLVFSLFYRCIFFFYRQQKHSGKRTEYPLKILLVNFTLLFIKHWLKFLNHQVGRLGWCLCKKTKTKKKRKWCVKFDSFGNLIDGKDRKNDALNRCRKINVNLYCWMVCVIKSYYHYNMNYEALQMYV